MKKLPLLLFMLLIVLNLVACDNNVGNDIIGNSKSDVKLETIPKSLKKKLSENVVIDAEIDTPKKLPKTAGIIPAKIKSLENKEKIKDILLGEEPIIINDKQTNKDREGKSIQEEYFRTESKKTLIWYGKLLTFSTPLSHDISDAFNPQTDDKNYNSKDLSFENRDQAIHNTKKFLKTLGVEVSENVRLNALDYKTMKEKQIKNYNEMIKDAEGKEKNKINPVRNWTQDDECYFMRFKQELNGICVSSGNGLGDAANKTETNGPIIDVYYGKQGYQSVFVGNIYEPTGNATQNGTPIDLNKALDIVKNKYDEVIMKRPITITDIEFSYVPQLKSANEENYILTPAWLFNLAEYSDDIKDSIDKRLIINALTGEQME